MPSAIVVGDQPVYVLILEFRSENAELFSKIVPFMGQFYIQMSFIYAMYKRGLRHFRCVGGSRCNC